jgi:hypothetical protein
MRETAREFLSLGEKRYLRNPHPHRALAVVSLSLSLSLSLSQLRKIASAICIGF